MRLTLKRLLDYGEDRLSPEQTRELGQILAEHPDAAKLVQVLEKAGKGPRLPRGEEETRVPLAQLALYLDDRMDPATELEFEKRAYRDPELLGEIARCHEALSRALPTPTLLGEEEEGSEGPVGLSWPGGALNLAQIQSIINGDGLPDEEEPEAPGWKSPYYHLEKHIFEKNPDRFGGLEWDNARGWLWRSVLIGVCLVVLSAALTYFNDREKWDQLARWDNSKSTDSLNTGKVELKPEVVPDLDIGKEFPAETKSGEIKKALPPKEVEKKETKTGSGKTKIEPGKIEEPPPVQPVEAGQSQVVAIAGTPVEGMPFLMWAKAAAPQKLNEGDLISWGRDVFIPPGFAGIVDSRVGWKACSLSNCPPLTGKDLPLGTRFRLEASPRAGHPAIHLVEGRLEVFGTLSQPDEVLFVRVCGQELRVTSQGRFHFLIEAVPRPPRSEEIDWTLVVSEGAIRVQEHDTDSPVLMMAPPGLCLARHSPLTGVSMEKRTRPPMGLMAESIKTMVRFKEFVAAANEVLAGAKDKFLDPPSLDRQFNQPSANLAKKVLLVFLSAWADDVKLPLKALMDNRASMKELREGAVISLGQMSRDRRAVWDKAFQSPSPGLPPPVEATVPGEVDQFRQLVEAIGRGQFSPPLVSKSLDLLLDGKTLGMREVAYQYLRMVNSPDEGPRYDPAESENARKLSQKEWRRLVKGDNGSP